MRGVFARQLLFSGVGAVPFIVLVAMLAGVVVVAEAYFWLQMVGGTQSIGGLLVVLVGRELGPLFVNIIVIVRSGSALATEMAVMQTSGGVRALEAQGIDPFLYLLMPRVLAVTLATFCLTVFFNLTAFATGYGFGVFTLVIPNNPGAFLNAVFSAIEAADVVSIVLKSTIPAALTGIICVTQGLSATASMTSVTKAVRRALSRSIAALFVASVIISMLTY